MLCKITGYLEENNIMLKKIHIAGFKVVNSFQRLKSLLR